MTNEDIHASSASNSEVVYQNPYQRIFVRTVNYAAYTKRYFVNDFGRRAAVVLVSPEGVLLTRQYRNLIDRLSWEIPGGRVEDDESPMDAARRECLEETGLHVEHLESLIAFMPGLDTNLNPTDVFTAQTDSVQLPPREADNEVSSRHWVGVDRCIDMIANGQIVDSLSIVGLLAYERFKRWPR